MFSLFSNLKDCAVCAKYSVHSFLAALGPRFVFGLMAFPAKRFQVVKLKFLAAIVDRLPVVDNSHRHPTPVFQATNA